MRSLSIPQLIVPPRKGRLPRRRERSAEAPSRPVRVCFLIDELAPAGTEMQLLALIHHLDRRRVRPYLCLLRGDSPASQALEPDDCPIRRLGVRSLHHPATLAKLWRFARFLRREKIDVLQAYFPDSGYFGLPAALLARVKHRIRTRNNLGHWLTSLHRRLGRALNLLTTRTIANCQAARQALLETEHPRPETVVVFENGVDLERFRNVPPLTPQQAIENPRIGILANLRPVKGLDIFIQAACKIRERFTSAVFEVAGEGDRSIPERQAKEAGLSDCFRLLGGVAEVPEFLAGLDVAVLSSHAEGMSNALLEYMAAGRPIVATAVGAAVELIEHEVHGLLVPPGDAERLADAIERLLGDRILARRLGEAARRRVEKRYSRAAMVRRFEAFYVSLIAENGRRKCPTS